MDTLAFSFTPRIEILESRFIVFPYSYDALILVKSPIIRVGVG